MKIKVFLFIFFTSCITYNEEKCEDLATKVFQGNTTLQSKWEKNCNEVEAQVTLHKCRIAFNELVLKGNEKVLKKKFGNRIMNCFTEKDKNLLIKSTITDE